MKSEQIVESVPGAARNAGLVAVHDRICTAFRNAGLEPTEEKNILVTYIIWKLLKTMPREQISKASLDQIVSKEFEPDGSIRWPIEDLIKEDLWNKLRDVATSVDEDQADDLVLCRYPWSEESTPDAVCKLAAGILEIRETDRIADLCCGCGGFMATAHERCPGAEITGIESSADKAEAAKLRAKVAGERLSVHRMNAFALDSQSCNRFDKVFCHPPLNLKWGVSILRRSPLSRFIESVADEFPEIAASRFPEWLFCLQAIKLMVPGGRTVCLITERALRSLRDRKIRECLVAKGLVESVVMLPRNMQNQSAAKASLIVFSKGNRTVRMADAKKYNSNYGWDDKNAIDFLAKINAPYWNETSFVRDVTVEEIAGNRYSFCPERYFTKKDI